MTDLSSAAQAVLDAYNSRYLTTVGLAAALRAAASQMEFVQDVQRLRAIAAELDQPTSY